MIKVESGPVFPEGTNNRDWHEILRNFKESYKQLTIWFLVLFPLLDFFVSLKKMFY